MIFVQGYFILNHYADRYNSVVSQILYRVLQKKLHKVNAPQLILQPYVTESCDFQQYDQKEFVYRIKASVWVQQLNTLHFADGKWTIWKQN